MRLGLLKDIINGFRKSLLILERLERRIIHNYVIHKWDYLNSLFVTRRNGYKVRFAITRSYVQSYHMTSHTSMSYNIRLSHTLRVK